MGKERQKKHVQYTASQEEHRGCWLQRRKEKQFLKSCQWKYKSEMTKLTLHDQFLCFEMVNSERVDWLQNITSPLLLKYKVQMGCTHVKKNKGMCYVLKNSSDALLQSWLDIEIHIFVADELSDDMGSVEMRQHELKELMASDVTFQLKHKWRFQQLQPFAVKVTESEDQFYDLMLHRGTLNSEADTLLGLLSLCYMGTVVHFYLGSYQKFSEIQRPHLLQKLHSGFIVLLQDNVCFRVLVLLGLSLARTILQRVHNIWHRWRSKNWWFKFKNKAVLYTEAWGQASFQRWGY
ncbi:unnamed protein product [Brassica oleracea]